MLDRLATNQLAPLSSRPIIVTVDAVRASQSSPSVPAVISTFEFLALLFRARDRSLVLAACGAVMEGRRRDWDGFRESMEGVVGSEGAAP